MSYKIIIDSCGDIPQSLEENEHVEKVALTIMIDDEVIVDDETFDQESFLKKVKASDQCPKSACPSPEQYMKLYESNVDRIYVIALSAKLSGSYNSAVLAKNLYEGEHEQDNKSIICIDSVSASIGQALLAMEIIDGEEAGLSKEKIIERVETLNRSKHTYFVLETLEMLRKNGRLSNLKAVVAEILNIKPVMGSDETGSIIQIDKTRGMKKALNQMVKKMIADTPDTKDRILGIAHCNCPERAQSVLEIAKSMAEFKDSFIVNTGGISSLYAADGGIIMAI